jgi:hypothetical protein
MIEISVPPWSGTHWSGTGVPPAKPDKRCRDKVKRRGLLFAHTRSPEPLIRTSPVVCGPFIRSERGD